MARTYEEVVKAYNIVIREQENSVRSGLLRLPAEIRLQIYALLAADNCVNGIIGCPCSHPERIAPSIIHVCRKIRNEAIPVFYKGVLLEVVTGTTMSVSSYSLPEIDPHALHFAPSIELEDWTHGNCHGRVKVSLTTGLVTAEYKRESEANHVCEHSDHAKEKQREWLAAGCAASINRDRSKTKEAVMELSESIREIVGQECDRIMEPW